MGTVLGFVLAIPLFLVCGGKPAAPDSASTVITEASGVIFHDGALYVVDDSAESAYFRVPLPKKPSGLIPLNGPATKRLELRNVGIWVDLEGIAFLADNRIALLSERFRGLAGRKGIIAEYDYPLTEFGRRGLEGVAVRPLANEASRIAVLWEGGYPDVGSLQAQLSEKLGEIPLNPMIFVHDLAAGATVGRIRWKSGLMRCALRPPKPAGEEPKAQRFRAPDLVWYRWPGSQPEQWGFIVLLSSQNAVANPQYLHHWLQRFNTEGVAVGDPIEIADYVPKEVGCANWEGLCWYEEGKSVVLVHEGRGKLQPHAFFLELPADWQYDR